MTPDFWKGKKVLITGHTGFKGSWLALWLQSLSAVVIGYSLQPPTTPSLYEELDLDNDIVSHLGDIRNLNSLKAIIEQEQPEIVIHLAAQSLVRNSYINPVETYSSNVMGTVNLLEAIRQTDCVRVAIIVTSDKCYANREWLWGYREDDPMGGHDPYSSSKGCAELITAAYRSSYFHENQTKVASVRAGNVIGGGDWAQDRLIPDFMRAIFAQEAVLIRNPNAIRPWQHVLEPLSGYLLLAEKLWQEGPDYVGSWNFGPLEEDAKSVEWIIKHLQKLWGEGATWNMDNNQHFHEAMSLKLDITKARIKLGWKPAWSLDLALQLIVEWYKAYQKKLDVKKLMLNQIVLYQSALTPITKETLSFQCN